VNGTSIAHLPEVPIFRTFSRDDSGILLLHGSINPGAKLYQFFCAGLRSRKDKARKQLLRNMLEAKNQAYPQRWRSLTTRMHVIGASEETTKRLLLEIGARASENGQDLWGLVKYHPLGSIDTK
jgi:hypothetical protein